MRHRRRKKLIKPGIQMRMVAAFLCVGVVVILIQGVVLFHMLTRLAADLPNEGGLIVKDIPAMVGRSLLIGTGLIIPSIFVIGVLVTFRVAGPLYRFEMFLKQVANGEKPGPCKLRKGDELKGLCELLNVVTAPLREGEVALLEGGDPEEHSTDGPASEGVRSVA